MHEILTLQCGNAANYIGTHFWNFQDPTSEEQSAIDHDVLFGSGQARNGMATYTPRLLIYDQARNFGSMKRINALFSEVESPADTSAPTTTIHTSKPVTNHPFQTSLEEGTGEEDEGEGGGTFGNASLLSDANVRFWSDYNTHFYRPGTYRPLDTFGNTAVLPDFESGREAYRARDRAMDVLDTDLRPFLEESDGLAGFHVLGSLVDGWGGYCAELVGDLSHEFPKMGKLLLSTTRARTRAEHVNLGSAVLAMHDEVDALVPFDLDDASPTTTTTTTSGTTLWSSAARAANWLDVITLPQRTKTLDKRLALADVLSFMTPQHKLFGAQLSGSALGAIDKSSVPGTMPVERRFRVTRDARRTDTSLESTLMQGGALVTTYVHPSTQSYPTSFPRASRSSDRDRGDHDHDHDHHVVYATLEDSALGSVAYLARTRDMIGGIRGAKGHAERKEQVEELVELAGRYRGEFMASDQESDDDGF